MFHKFNKHHFRATLKNIKHHIGNGYHHVKDIAHNVDYGVNVAKQVYKILEPVISDYAGTNHIGTAMKAISGYENLRNKAMEADHHIGVIGNKLSGLI